jgi:hypothetical protein
MTVPRERKNAISITREFLRRLLDPKLTPRVPKKIRVDAYWCLRHYPSELDMEQAKEDSPEIWGDEE